MVGQLPRAERNELIAKSQPLFMPERRAQPSPVAPRAVKTPYRVTVDTLIAAIPHAFAGPAIVLPIAARQRTDSALGEDICAAAAKAKAQLDECK